MSHPAPAGDREAWADHPVRRRLATLFDAEAGASLAVARDRAVALLADDRWARQLIIPLAAALARDAMFEPPVRSSREGGRTGMVLFDAPAARVSASVLSAAALARQAPATVVATGHCAVVRYVRAGGARLRRWHVPDPCDDASARARENAMLLPSDGDVVVTDGRRQAQAVAGADADVVMLTVALRAEAAPLMREYRIADGALVRVASNDEGASRTTMLLALLRAAGRRDAGEVFAAATRAPAFHARWEAMREWLALDAAAALPRLAEMAADDPHGEVRVAAATTLATARRRRPCPA